MDVSPYASTFELMDAPPYAFTCEGARRFLHSLSDEQLDEYKLFLSDVHRYVDIHELVSDIHDLEEREDFLLEDDDFDINAIDDYMAIVRALPEELAYADWVLSPYPLEDRASILLEAIHERENEYFVKTYDPKNNNDVVIVRFGTRGVPRENK